jgi:hypothetical protein
MVYEFPLFFGWIWLEVVPINMIHLEPMKIWLDFVEYT